MHIRLDNKTKRKNRTRSKIFGTKEVPRFSFSKTNQHLYGQLINDEDGKTLAYISSLKMDAKKTKKEKAIEIGKSIAEEAKKQKITKVVFDRRASSYTGIVKECADAARGGGLKF